MPDKEMPSQPCRQKNIDAIVAYFESGIKASRNDGKLGIEVEHFVINDDKSPVQYHEEHGVDWLLEQLTAAYPMRILGTNDELIGAGKPGATVTLEPGAQIELSAGPYQDIDGAQADFEEFISCVNTLMQPYGRKVVSYGYRPAGHASEVALIPKTRYDIMDRYFESIGPFGTCMMRGSAATQISIDYFSVADCLRKMKVASILAPLFSLICDNTPVFEDKPRTHAAMRSDVWRYCDPDRSGVVKGVLSPDFSLAQHAANVLDTPAILLVENGTARPTARTFGEEYSNRVMTRKEIEHALSMLFTDVRLKTYIEIRPADSLPPAYVASYAALVKGLLYNDDTLNELEEHYAGATESDIESAKLSIAEHGFEGEAYGSTAAQELDYLFEKAARGLQPNELPHLKPLCELAQKRTTLADLHERQ